jgi:hypothetical protein
MSWPKSGNANARSECKTAVVEMALAVNAKASTRYRDVERL